MNIKIDQPFTVEELTALSRAEALDVQRRIAKQIKDARMFTESVGSVFKDIDACATDCCKVSV